MFITRSLDKLLKDVQQTKKSYYSQVERACSSLLQDIRSVESSGKHEHKALRQKSVEYEQSTEEDINGSSANLDLLVGEEVRPQVSVDSEKFFIPFELACKGDVAKITITALDGIQKIVAYGELLGDYPDPKTPTRRLIDRIVDTICGCHKGQETEEGVELQIIKALLTITTSHQVHVHESTLLLILRTCNLIHLTAKSTVNRHTARAMLTQMLHSIFQRIECIEEEDGSSKQFQHRETTDLDFSLYEAWEAEVIELVRECFSRSSIFSVPLSSKRAAFNPTPTLPTQDVQNNLVLDTVRDINQNSEGLSEKFEHVETITPSQKGSGEDERGNLENQDSLSSSVVIENDSHDAASVQKPSNHCYSSMNNLASLLQKDAFLSFWTLSKMALKSVQKLETEKVNDKSVSDAKYQQTILAFHLLKEILENSGKVFQRSPIFINAIRQHLCTTLLENGISSNTEVFKLEIDILMTLLFKFQESLAVEIQELLSVLLFPVLESPTLYSAEQVKITLHFLRNISQNLNCFVQLYLTYDHDPCNEFKPFHKIVVTTSKIICDREGNEKISIEIVTNFLKSMSAACPKLTDNYNTSETEKSARFSSMEDGFQFTDDIVHNLELEGSDFLTCLHLFLSKMSTNEDALRTDWLIQKLAQRMTDSSSVNSFRTETADCWYSLIYASLSLIADIRITNCQGKSKMSRSQFIKLNRAINGCEPLVETFLSSIYDEIEVAYNRDGDRSCSTEKVKWAKIVGKTEKDLLEVTQYILELTSLLRSHFSLGKQLKHVKRMIKICGTSFLIALISALQNTNDTQLSDMCLDGIHSGIHSLCILGLDNEREAYVQALAKLSFTALDEIRGKHVNSKIVTTKTSTLTMTENGVTKTVVTTTTEMKCRSVDIVLTLLDVGIAEGNYLGGSWLHILKFMSQLLSTPLLAESRNSSRSSSPVPPTPTSLGSSGWAAWAGSLKESLEKKLWDPSATTLHPSAKESIATSVEKVFKRSEMLTGDAMTDFFQGLCQVSLHDMMNADTPKHLMYERINEVADLNMYRPALQWSQIWQVVADYFCHLACSSKEEISMLAIDSIQKLVLKLLKKETLNGYRFQNHYFSPFKVIITNARSQSTREAVLGFVETVISLHGDLLLSGWIAILSILVTNMLNHSNDKDASVDSFRVLQRIVDKSQRGEINLRNSFGSIVKSLVDIAGNVAPTLEMSEQAFRLLTQMAEIPFRQPHLLMEENDDKRYRVWARGWKPILGELSPILCSDCNSQENMNQKVLSWDIKTKALITLFELIKTCGGSFEKEWWNSVFEVLFNIFNSIKSREKEDLLFAIFDVYIQYYDATDSYAFDELLKHLQWCICQDHEQIALSGVSCLQQLVVALGAKFSVSQWDSILGVFQTICKPSEFMQNDNLECPADEAVVTQSAAIRAIMQLELLKIMERITFLNGRAALLDDGTNSKQCQDENQGEFEHINPLLTSGQIFVILDILSRSHEIAKNHCIVANSTECESLDKGRSEMPNFIPHETLSLQIYWRILFSMFKTDSLLSKLGIPKDSLWEMIERSCIRSCGYFVTIQLKKHRDAWADLLCFTIGNILALPKPNFRTLTSNLYPYFCEMLEVDLDGKICDQLREYLLVLGKDYHIALH